MVALYAGSFRIYWVRLTIPGSVGRLIVNVVPRVLDRGLRMAFPAFPVGYLVAPNVLRQFAETMRYPQPGVVQSRAFGDAIGDLARVMESERVSLTIRPIMKMGGLFCQLRSLGIVLYRPEKTIS